MPNPQILEYVTQARTAGMLDDRIRQNLTQAGWAEKDISEVLAPADADKSVRRRKMAIRIGLGAIIIIALGGGGYFASAKYGLFGIIKDSWQKVSQKIPFIGVSNTPLPSLTPFPDGSPIVTGPGSTEKKSEQDKVFGLEKFASAEEFKAYMQSAQSDAYGFGGSFLGAGALMRESSQSFTTPPNAQGISSTADYSGSPGPERISQTNVQVQGIDEPDIVKTDGKNIYFAQKFTAYPYPMMDDVRAMPPVGDAAMPQSGISRPAYPYPAPKSPETKVLKAFPPASVAKVGAIAKSGNLLLSNDILIVLPTVQQNYGYYGNAAEASAIWGYDVSNPAAPKELWKVELKESTSLSDARLRDGKLYAITRTSFNYENPCPIVPLILKNSPVSIPCGDIYHPTGRVASDSTFTAMAIDPADGKVGNKVSFVAPGYQSILYMSPEALYVSYPLAPDIVGLYFDFFNEKGRDLLTVEMLDKLRKLREYDLSDSAKMIELMQILQRLTQGADKDERLKLENELANRSKAFFKEHARELTRTALVKIGLSDLSIAATGEFPGGLLNQFSMDEYKGHLRVATTIDGNSGFGFGFGSGVESVNDVYVLDAGLKIVGSVLDMGLTERIYSARFVEDRGYIVTFRQTDPFYVLDLSNPSKPERKGELKIPGFSSYLHPISENMVLGVGQEGSQVKLSLFDVSDAAHPVEKDKYNMNEYWTEVSNTHHAFLQDEKHKVFFLPGSRGGYVFSYANNQLKLEATVADVQAERAIYINDYLYIIANNKIVVFNEKDWQKVNQLEF